MLRESGQFGTETTVQEERLITSYLLIKKSVTLIIGLITNGENIKLDNQITEIIEQPIKTYTTLKACRSSLDPKGSLLSKNSGT